MKNEEYYLLLNRYTSLQIKKEDVEDYLEHCKIFNVTPISSDFLDYLGSRYSFDNFDEELVDTEIDDDTQFYELIKEIERND